MIFTCIRSISIRRRSHVTLEFGLTLTTWLHFLIIKLMSEKEKMTVYIYLSLIILHLDLVFPMFMHQFPLCVDNRFPRTFRFEDVICYNLCFGGFYSCACQDHSVLSIYPTDSFLFPYSFWHCYWVQNNFFLL